MLNNTKNPKMCHVNFVERINFIKLMLSCFPPT